MPHCYSYDPVYLGRTRRTAPCLILIQLYLCISLHFVIQVLDLFNLKRQDERATRWQVVVKAVVKLSVSSPFPFAVPLVASSLNYLCVKVDHQFVSTFLGPASLCGTAPCHSTTTPLTPFFSRRARISPETS